MPNQIIYPGTFDPITNGHIDLIERASRLFDRVIVAIAASEKKSNLFTLAEREQLAREALAKHQNIEICTYSGLSIEFARTKGVLVILRGLRAISDYEYELQLANLNRVLEPKIETVFLTPAEKYAYISASMIREIASFGGDVSAFVPVEVQQALKKKSFLPTKP
ncbi:MAG: Phosphopantetheine adenylyltransferase [uncultured bacterium]|nr:MAG: Phosphopantetheine adenylyltransferase [uncultured bacterium]